MSFYGKVTEPDQARPLKTFVLKHAESAAEQIIHAHDVYFYESGHIGFWNETTEDDRELVLATQAFSVREIAEGRHE